MSNNLFAFNVSQETPESEVVNLPNGEYSASQQTWVGAEGKLLSCCGSYCSTTSSPCGYPCDCDSQYCDCE